MASYNMFQIRFTKNYFMYGQNYVSSVRLVSSMDIVNSRLKLVFSKPGKYDVMIWTIT